MSLADCPNWLQPVFAKVMAQRAALPHALLFQGLPGLGQPALMQALAEALLCHRPGVGGAACGVCVSCQLLAAGNHPDLLWLRPGDDEESASNTRKSSSQIRIDAVRRLIETLTLVPHQGALRVVVIEPIDALNPAAANALLKTLEEPPPGNVLLLVNHASQRLLPTVRSRCVTVRLQRPAVDMGATDEGDAALSVFTGSPLPDPEQQAAWPVRKALLSMLERGRDLSLPAATRVAGLTLPLALDTLARWLHDLARVQAGGTPRFLPGHNDALQRIARQTSAVAVVHMAHRLQAWQRHAEHPLQLQLTLADILLEYRSELFPAPRSAA